jgi:ribosomal protein S4E
MRSTFSDAAATFTPSPDIIGSPLASGGHVGPSRYSLVNGTIIIQNNTATAKRYYYIAGNSQCKGAPGTMTNYGGNWWAENNIIAIKLN